MEQVKDLQASICKEARRFIKDNLLIGKSDLRSKYSAKNIKTAPGVDSNVKANKLQGNSRGSKIYEYQMQIYLRMEVASLARAPQQATVIFMILSKLIVARLQIVLNHETR